MCNGGAIVDSPPFGVSLLLSNRKPIAVEHSLAARTGRGGTTGDSIPGGVCRCYRPAGPLKERVPTETCFCGEATGQQNLRPSDVCMHLEGP